MKWLTGFGCWFVGVGRPFIGRIFCCFVLVFGFFGFVLVLVFILGKLVESVVGNGAGFDDDASLIGGFEADTLEIQRRGLQAVEHKASGLRIDMLGDDEAQNLHQRDLNRLDVLEGREFEGVGEVLKGAFFVEWDSGLTPAVMEVAKAACFERGRAALGSIDFDVLTSRDAARI